MAYKAFSWFLILFACFYGISSYPLLDENEGVYASIARDMLTGGHWVIPHLNGLPYIEKPPMIYWLLAASMALFGMNEGAAHLVPALALFATAVALKRFVQRASNSEATGFTAALMLVTAAPFLCIARMVLYDMVLTAFLCTALLMFFRWYAEGGKNFLLGFYALLAFAVLTKGMIAVLIAGGIILAFLFWQRSPAQKYASILIPQGLLLFFAIAAPWHIAAMNDEFGFAWYYFINEQLVHLLNLRDIADNGANPPPYYLFRVLVYLLPWTFFLLLFTRRPAQPISHLPGLARFLGAWFLFSLFIFSVSTARSHHYMMVGLPALVALLALHLNTFMSAHDRVTRSLTTGGLLLVLVGVWFVTFFCSEIRNDMFAVCKAIPEATMRGALMYAGAGIVLCWRLPQRWLVPLLAANILLLAPLAIASLNISSDDVSQKGVAQYLQSESFESVAVYQEFEELSALAFYTDHPLIIVDSHSYDLLYGKHTIENPPNFITLLEWVEHDPPIPMIVLKNKIDTVMANLHSMDINLRHVCITRRFSRVALMQMCE